MRFDLTDLRLFLAVADAGSITHGAQEIGLSLAAASDRLREMELAGGVSLLERGRRGIRLTEAGETLSHHARQIIGHVALMRADLGQFAKGLRATIRMAVNTAAMVDTLPQRLTPWLADHPQVDIDLRERQSHEIARSVTAGFSDIPCPSRRWRTRGHDAISWSASPRTRSRRRWSETCSSICPHKAQRRDSTGLKISADFLKARCLGSEK